MPSISAALVLNSVAKPNRPRAVSRSRQNCASRRQVAAWRRKYSAFVECIGRPFGPVRWQRAQPHASNAAPLPRFHRAANFIVVWSVPRTRSSHTSCCKSRCELRVQKGHWNHRVASGPLIPKFASERAASCGELGIGPLARSAIAGIILNSGCMRGVASRAVALHGLLAQRIVDRRIADERRHQHGDEARPQHR
jgi:hypothetical protein